MSALGVWLLTGGSIIAVAALLEWHSWRRAERVPPQIAAASHQAAGDYRTSLERMIEWRNSVAATNGAGKLADQHVQHKTTQIELLGVECAVVPAAEYKRLFDATPAEKRCASVLLDDAGIENLIIETTAGYTQPVVMLERVRN